MKTLYSTLLGRTRVAPAILILLFLTSPLVAARISEPDTIFYGKVVQTLGQREFMVSNGSLLLKIVTSGPGAGEYSQTTQLQSIGNGRYSYQLHLPHQLIAYDLSVAADKVPYGNAGTKISSITASLDGRALLVKPLVVAQLNLSASARASAYRVDFQFETPPLDSDGDGLPDWWEDAHGLDKWDPSDGASNGGSGATSPALAPDAHTFAEWRATLFPGENGNLGAFGEADSDGDGIANFIEYAFDLDPRQKDTAVAQILPEMFQGSEGPVLMFRRRIMALDVDLHIDISNDLIHWTDNTAELTITSESNTGLTTVKSTGSRPETQFYRVRVHYLPNP